MDIHNGRRTKKKGESNLVYRQWKSLAGRQQTRCGVHTVQHRRARCRGQDPSLLSRSLGCPVMCACPDVLCVGFDTPPGQFVCYIRLRISGFPLCFGLLARKGVEAGGVAEREASQVVRGSLVFGRQPAAEPGAGGVATWGGYEAYSTWEGNRSRCERRPGGSGRPYYVLDPVLGSSRVSWFTSPVGKESET